MTKYLFIIGMLFIQINSSFSQNNQSQLHQSNIQQQLEQPGKCIKVNFVDVVKVKDITVQLVKSTNISDNKTLNGLRIVYKVANSSGKYLGYIDLDEISDLVKTIEHLKATVFIKAPQVTFDDNLEYYYSCRSGLKIGGFAIFIAGSSSKTIWGRYILLGELNKERIVLSSEEFEQLMLVLKQAPNKFDATLGN